LGYAQGGSCSFERVHLSRVLAGDRAMEFSATWAPRVLSVLRIVDGLILLQYGLAKLVGWPAVEIFENLKWHSLFGIAGIFELVGGTLLILGLFTRPAAFVLSGEMAAAYFIEHFPRGFFPILSEGDLAVSLCFTFLYLAFAGGGPWSLDAVMRGEC
jgi:putative oxidoreductase